MPGRELPSPAPGLDPDLFARPFRVGNWTVEPARNVLESDRQSLRLEPKVMSVLVVLARHGGEVVTREALFDRVWPDVVVGDDALTMAVSKLRRALADDPQGQRFIETIPKTGYRLLADVNPIDPSAAEEREEPLDRPAPRSSSRIVQIAAGLAAGVALLVTLALWPSGARHESPVESGRKAIERPTESILTSMRGSELLGRLSRDGKVVAFVRQNVADAGLYVQRVKGGVPIRISHGSGYAVSPAWSPDGQTIAYLQCPEDRSGECDLLLVNAEGGPARRLLSYEPSPLVGIDWSPGGQGLAIARRAGPGRPFAIFRVGVEDGAQLQLTEPPEDLLGDARPTYSPDGRRLAFCRGPDVAVHDLFVLDLAGGPPRRLTFEPGRIWGLTWSAGGDELIYASNHEGAYQLYRLDADGGEPQWIPSQAREVRFPSISGDRLLYEAFSLDADLWKLEGAGPPSRLAALASNRWDISPRHSPDGRWLAFVSTRTGHPQVWVGAIDGTGLHRVGHLDATYLGQLDWSPDGAFIAVEGIFGRTIAVFLLEVATGVARRLPFDGSARHPKWSRDGRHLYVASNRSGSWQIWRQPVDGGEAERVTRDGGWMAVESMEATALFLVRENDPQLWSLDLTAAETSKPDRAQVLVDALAPGHESDWVVTAAGIFYLQLGENGLELSKIQPETGEKQRISNIHRSVFSPGLSVSRNGDQVVLSLREPMESDLRLIEGFR